MKKHLIAAAVAGALAVPAMAQVTVYGVIDQGYTTTETKLTAREGATASFVSNELDTSGNGSAYTSQRLGFRGEEDLGGGMKVAFNYELGLGDRDSADSGSDIMNDTVRQFNLGISGGFGSFRMGRMSTQADNALGVGDVGGGNNFLGRIYTTGYASALNETTGAITISGFKFNNSRSDKLIEYTTPSMSGITLAVQYGDRKSTVSGGETGSATESEATSHKETGLGLRYSAGPLNAMLGYSQEKVKTAGVKGSDPEQFALGVNYDLGMAKVFFTYMDGEAKTTSVLGETVTKLDNKGMEIGAAIPLGALTLQVSYFDAEAKATIGTGSLKGEIDGFQIAGLYALSKSTTAYVVYGQDELSASPSATESVTVDRDIMGLGIRHSF